VKRFGRDVSIWVVIHICLEAMLGITLYSYTYLKLPKTLCLIVDYFFSSTKLEKKVEQVLSGSKGVGRSEQGWGERGRDGPNNVCTFE
jgi:hypothetical protein